MLEQASPTARSEPASALRDVGRDRVVELFNSPGSAPVLLLCDHAGRWVPPELEDLGLPPSEIARHIGWDIGSADVARHLARLLDAPAVLCHVSRLVIDANRQPGDPSSMPMISDGTLVPGNQDLSPEQVRWRLRRFFLPYHRAVARQIARLRRGGVPVIISMHSFTPRIGDTWRPWHAAVLWDTRPASCRASAGGAEARVGPSDRRQQAVFGPLSGGLLDSLPCRAPARAARHVRDPPGSDRHACDGGGVGGASAPGSCANRCPIASSTP